MNQDFLIVGGGLAGSLIAYELIKKNKNVKIISDENLPAATDVAGGMVNPITGKYLTPTWLLEELFPFLDKYYTNFENEFSIGIYNKTGIFRPFSNEQNKTHFLSQILKNELQEYIDVLDSQSSISKKLNAPLGGLLTKNAGWVDVSKLRKTLKSHFEVKKIFINQKFEHKNLLFEKVGFTYNNDVFEKVIFCEGYYVKDNPFFSWLPFNSVKGEIITAQTNDYQISEVVNQGKWVIPLGKNKVKIGATYSWHDLDNIPTESAQKQLLSTFEKIFNGSYQVIDHNAGVRPATIDRRPIIGPHPTIRNMFIFNGLGTKGVSLAPYFINMFIEYLFNKKDIHSDTTIERFFALYSL